MVAISQRLIILSWSWETDQDQTWGGDRTFMGAFNTGSNSRKVASFRNWPAALYNHRKWPLIGKRANGAAAPMQPSIARDIEQLDPRQQLANTLPPQSDLHPVSIHQMASPQRTSNCSLLLIYRPQRMKGWVGRLADLQRTIYPYNFTRRMQVESRTGKVRLPRPTSYLPHHGAEPRQKDIRGWSNAKHEILTIP